MKFAVPFLAVALFAATAHASVTVEIESAPTPDLDGFTTFTLTFSADPGSTLGAFDFSSGDGFGFFGPLNQINPADAATVFGNNNSFFSFVGAVPEQDSQFLFTDIENDIVLATGSGFESDSSLGAAFALPVAAETLALVQLVIPDGEAVSFLGAVAVDDGIAEFPVDVTVSGVVPEPASLALLGLGGVMIAARRRKA